MPSDQTRASILEAAERLYAERGFADVTLRDIVAAANVNLAAVNYHFGSKDELIAELFVTRSLATNRERLNELKAAEALGGGRADIRIAMGGDGEVYVLSKSDGMIRKMTAVVTPPPATK